MPPTLPKSCEVAELAAWLWSLDTDEASYDGMARAVRALVEARVRASLAEFGEWVPESIEKHIAKILGSTALGAERAT